MIIYNYGRDTFELYGDGEEAQLDPIGQEPMIPAFATEVAPMSVGANEVPVFNEELLTWSVVADFRGVTYYDFNKIPSMITELGVDVPDGCTTEPPPETNGQYYTLTDGQWAPLPIDDLRNVKIEECYRSTVRIMDENLVLYSKGEMDTWSAMNVECTQYKLNGTVGVLMTKKINTDPIYNTADKLADMTITEYDSYLDGKYNLEAQRSQHKLNIINETDVIILMDYDTSVSL